MLKTICQTVKNSCFYLNTRRDCLFTAIIILFFFIFLLMRFPTFFLVIEQKLNNNIPKITQKNREINQEEKSLISKAIPPKSQISTPVTDENNLMLPNFLPNFFETIQKKFVKNQQAKRCFLKKNLPQRELQLTLYRKDLHKHLRVTLRQAANSATCKIFELYKQVADRITYYLEINQDGLIKNLFLTSQTGIEEFDTFLTNAARQAEPFPPIPKYLNLNHFVVFE